jgi:hypothetical protein
MNKLMIIYEGRCAMAVAMSYDDRDKRLNEKIDDEKRDKLIFDLIKRRSDGET